MKSLLKKLRKHPDRLTSTTISTEPFALPEFHPSDSLEGSIRQTLTQSRLLPSRRLTLADPSNQIRILHILPADANCPHVIQAPMSVASLGDNPQYEALSYTWGAPIRPKRISIDWEELAITENLYAALLRLRAKGHLTLWVDAICIDQENNEERSIQVSRMSTVFQQAQQVLIWLGEDSEEEDGRLSMAFFNYFDWELAVQWLSYHAGDKERAKRELETHPDKERLQAWLLGLRLYDIYQNYAHCLSCRKEATPESRRTADLLRNFFARPWFRRRWVYQEAYVARSATMICGEYALPWRILMQAFTILPYVPFGAIEANVAISLAFKQRAWTAPYVPATGPKEFLNALQSISELECEDDRDRVGALLSLWPSSTYTVDYSASVSENYFRFAKCLVEHGHYLDVLRAAVLYSREFLIPDSGDLPSWVPDWTQKYPKFISLVTEKSYAAKVSERQTLVIEGAEVVDLSQLSDRILEIVREEFFGARTTNSYLAQFHGDCYFLLEPVGMNFRLGPKSSTHIPEHHIPPGWKNLGWEKRTIEII